MHGRWILFTCWKSPKCDSHAHSVVHRAQNMFIYRWAFYLVVFCLVVVAVVRCNNSFFHVPGASVLFFPLFRLVWTISNATFLKMLVKYVGVKFYFVSFFIHLFNESISYLGNLINQSIQWHVLKVVLFELPIKITRKWPKVILEPNAKTKFFFGDRYICEAVYFRHAGKIIYRNSLPLNRAYTKNRGKIGCAWAAVKRRWSECTF